MEYCDEGLCPNFIYAMDSPTDCKLGFKNHFKMPNSWTAINQHDWGFVRPKECKTKFGHRQIKEGVSDGH
jgi:hypothetical protein